MPVSRFDLADLRLVRALARMVADKPRKAMDDSTADEDTSVYQDVLSILRGAERELLVTSPYFIPGDEVMAVFRELRTPGVSVLVLTNSLASTDMPPRVCLSQAPPPNQ